MGSWTRFASADVTLGRGSEDGTRRTILGNSEPLFDDQGRSRGAVSAFVDVTKLAEAVRARDAFLSMASHELKTTITSLQLQLGSLLRTRDGLPAQVAKAADASRRQVVRLTALVKRSAEADRRGAVPSDASQRH